MSTMKKSLQKMIERLTDEEARQIQEFVEHIRKKGDESCIVRHLSEDPALKIPSDEMRVFRKVTPLRGKGIPASKLLIENRR